MLHVGVIKFPEELLLRLQECLGFFPKHHGLQDAVVLAGAADQIDYTGGRLTELFDEAIVAVTLSHNIDRSDNREVV